MGEARRGSWGTGAAREVQSGRRIALSAEGGAACAAQDMGYGRLEIGDWRWRRGVRAGVSGLGVGS